MNKETTDVMVSVVMITFNQSHYIEKAIKGVIRQKVAFPIQLVICDDASTDGTPEIIEHWRERYPDIIEFRRNPANLGLAGNYLQALGMCRGRYVAMCDGDDYWFCLTKLQRQVDYMESHPECALSYHRVINYYEDTGEKRLSNGGGATRQSATAAQLAKHNTITNMSVMYRASLVDLKNLPTWMRDVRLIDFPLHLMFASRGTVHYMERPMGVYRKSVGVWTHSARVQRLKMALDVRIHMMRELSGNPEVVEAIRESCVDHLVAMIGEGDLKKAVLMLPETGVDISIGELQRMSGERSKSAVAKKSVLSRIVGKLTRFVPLP